MSEENPIANRARGLFPNKGMHRNAEFIASLHDGAIDYLTQAPVLAASFGVKKNTRADRLYIAMRIGGPIQRGERLRAVMAAVGVPYPLRKLCAYAITPMMSDFVRELADLDPSTLSQAIPAKPNQQRLWLTSMRDWRRRMRMHCRSASLGFSWFARHAHQCPEHRAGELADFVIRHPDIDLDRWSMERMMNEVELWHDRVAADQSVTRYGFSLTPNTVIDISDWPDHSEHAGFEFFKLATPGMIMEEGRRQRHCVATYIPLVMAGRCSLFSIRQEMRRLATVQIERGRVVQIKAFANRAPSNPVRAAAEQFAKTGMSS